MMKKYERALQELSHWTIKSGGGMQILFAAHTPSIVDGIPHPWQCIAAASSNTGMLYHAYGTSVEDAILKCHARWYEQKHGYMWEEVDTETWIMTPERWFDYQQAKSSGGNDA